MVAEGNRLPQRMLCLQTWSETPEYYPHLSSAPQLTKLYPLLFSSYQLDSDMPILFSSELFRCSSMKLLRPAQVPFSHKIPKVLTMYSNCNTPSKRGDYILPFIKQFPSLVANYGKCWDGNSSVNAYQKNGIEEKMDLVQTHMFTFCLDNAYTTDWVTEKVY